MEDTNTIAKLKNYCEEHNSSLAGVARMIPLASSTLSMWVNGKYAGNSKNVEKLVTAFLERQTEIAKIDLREIPFMMLSNAEAVFDIAYDCQVRREIGVLVGEAGSGKTMAVKEYTAKNGGVILIEADLGYSAKVLFKELHRRLGLDGIGHIHDLFDKVVKRLENSNRLIIVDEAEYLPYRALELIRRINDKARIGILLTGLPRLIHNLSGFKGEYQQLYSRVGMVRRLDKFTEDDVEMLVKDFFPNSNGVWKSFYKRSGGNGRLLEKMLLRSRDALQLNGLKTVNEDVVDAVSKILLH